MATAVCRCCGDEFETAGRGRPPTMCYACRATSPARRPGAATPVDDGGKEARRAAKTETAVLRQARRDERPSVDEPASGRAQDVLERMDAEENVDHATMRSRILEKAEYPTHVIGYRIASDCRECAHQLPNDGCAAHRPPTGRDQCLRFRPLDGVTVRRVDSIERPRTKSYKPLMTNEAKRRKVCANCGREYKVSDLRNAVRYCDECCESMSQKTCCVCGKTMRRSPHQAFAEFQKRRTCSSACGAKLAAETRATNERRQNGSKATA